MSQDETPIINNAELESQKLQEEIENEQAYYKRRSIKEKRNCSLEWRQSHEWSGIFSQDQLNKKYQEAVADYQSGNFFMKRIGRYGHVDSPLTLTVFHMRQEWIDEYDVKTVPEFLILDMAMTSYFHFLRLNEQVNNILANIEWEMFALDAPRSTDSYWVSDDTRKQDRKVAEELAHRLAESLQPVIDQFNRMFIRNLKALRDLRKSNVLLNIEKVGQVNIGDKQINVERT